MELEALEVSCSLRITSFCLSRSIDLGLHFTLPSELIRIKFKLGTNKIAFVVVVKEKVVVGGGMEVRL